MYYAGRYWSGAKAQLTFWDAYSYCKSIGGQLPTIDELRLLVYSCKATTYGGPCPVYTWCATKSCLNPDTCLGCGASNGMSALGDSGTFWSGTMRSDVMGQAFFVDYASSAVNLSYSNEIASAYCVKKWSSGTGGSGPGPTGAGGMGF
jgi:hypothetical protein